MFFSIAHYLLTASPNLVITFEKTTHVSIDSFLFFFESNNL